MFGSTTATPTATPARIGASRALAGLALGASLGLLLVGCSGSDAPAKTPESSGTESSGASEQDQGAADAGSTSAGTAETSVTVDGKAVDIADPTTVCHEADGMLTIAVGAAGGTEGIGAVLSGGDAPQVTSVALGSVDGTVMGWAEGAPGEASATKQGSTYTITGSMMAVDAANPAAPAEKPFEMRITCP